MPDADPHDPFGSHDTSRIANSHLTRRRMLAGTATVGGTLVGGGALLAHSTDAARATVAVDELTVPDAKFEKASVTPELQFTIDYAYAVADGADIAAVYLAASVGGDVIAEQTLSTSTTAADSDASLQGQIVNASAWSTADFSVAVGESVERTLDIGVTLEVRDSDGGVLAGDDASTQATVTVSHPEDSQTTASVGAAGEIVD